MYGHQQGLEDGAEQANRRNRAHRDMEIWDEMENLLRYPTPAVERRCMEIVGRRRDVTISRTTGNNRGNNRGRFTENNNNNQGSGIKRRRRRRKKSNRSGVVSWAWLDNNQTRSLREMAKNKRSKRQTKKKSQRRRTLSKEKMRSIMKAMSQRYNYFQNNRVRDIKPNLSVIRSLSK
tara:strand:- start:625 stop:1155 length:531 start_codon:yes stop_codon:yes gene_type:complete